LYFNWVGGSLSRHLKKNPQNDRNQWRWREWRRRGARS
jgi:hypothetical protein